MHPTGDRRLRVVLRRDLGHRGARDAARVLDRVVDVDSPDRQQARAAEQRPLELPLERELAEAVAARGVLAVGWGGGGGVSGGSANSNRLQRKLAVSYSMNVREQKSAASSPCALRTHARTARSMLAFDGFGGGPLPAQPTSAMAATKSGRNLRRIALTFSRVALI
jgi:hypothetical protein